MPEAAHCCHTWGKPPLCTAGLKVLLRVASAAEGKDTLLHAVRFAAQVLLCVGGAYPVSYLKTQRWKCFLWDLLSVQVGTGGCAAAVCVGLGLRPTMCACL